jgi:hypothetical protein
MTVLGLGVSTAVPCPSTPERSREHHRNCRRGHLGDVILVQPQTTFGPYRMVPRSQAAICRKILGTALSRETPLDAEAIATRKSMTNLGEKSSVTDCFR